MIWSTYEASRSITPEAPRHWPDAGHDVSPEGKRGVATSLTKSLHSSAETTPPGRAVPK
jgi:hypothetical protein